MHNVHKKYIMYSALQDDPHYWSGTEPLRRRRYYASNDIIKLGCRRCPFVHAPI